MHACRRYLQLLSIAVVAGAVCCVLPHRTEWAHAEPYQRIKEKAITEKQIDQQKIPLDVQTWGLPDGGQLGLPAPWGIACYAGQWRFNRYTLELLTAKSLEGNAERSDRFKADQRWPAEFRATLADYKTISETYDRGHEACSADQSDQDAQDATFLLSNMCPQHKKLNRGLWKQLEQYLRDTAQRKDVAGVWVVTMPLFCPGDATQEVPEQGRESNEFVQYNTAGPNHIPIPTHFAKVALVLGNRHDNPIVLMAWLMPNRAPVNGETLDTSRVTVDLVEHWSGLDFFALLPDGIEERLESRK
jgi:endonuclease G